jgi:hypothetical protein
LYTLRTKSDTELPDRAALAHVEITPQMVRSAANEIASIFDLEVGGLLAEQFAEQILEAALSAPK